jgi:hypothetical protein
MSDENNKKKSKADSKTPDEDVEKSDTENDLKVLNLDQAARFPSGSQDFLDDRWILLISSGGGGSGVGLK